VASAYIHSIPTEELTAEAAAAKYEGELKAFYRADTLDPARPLFDVNLLGLGPDGHTASLFPGTSVLNERERWVVPVVGPNGEMRITLTYPVLESARHTVFLVTGEEKRAIFARFRQGDRTLPAANLHPSGKLWLFADAAAAGTATT
jgi:6-phosphogluconolactonase